MYDTRYCVCIKENREDKREYDIRCHVKDICIS